jgi:hypothetical protein
MPGFFLPVLNMQEAPLYLLIYVFLQQLRCFHVWQTTQLQAGQKAYLRA